MCTCALCIITLNGCFRISSPSTLFLSFFPYRLHTLAVDNLRWIFKLDLVIRDKNIPLFMHTDTLQNDSTDFFYLLFFFSSRYCVVFIRNSSKFRHILSNVLTFRNGLHLDFQSSCFCHGQKSKQKNSQNVREKISFKLLEIYWMYLGVYSLVLIQNNVLMLS